MYLTHPNSRQTKVSAGDYEGKYILHPKTLSKNQAVHMQYLSKLFYQTFSTCWIWTLNIGHRHFRIYTTRSWYNGTFWKKYKVDTGSTYLLTKNVLISENLFVIWALPFLACHKNNVSLFVSFWRNTDRYFGINSFDVCGGGDFWVSVERELRTQRTKSRIDHVACH